MHRQHEHARRDAGVFDLPRERDAVLSRQTEIDDGDVGTLARHGLRADQTIGRLGDDVVAGGRERGAQTHARERVIFDEHQPRRRHSGSSGSVTTNRDPRVVWGS